MATRLQMQMCTVRCGCLYQQRNFCWVESGPIPCTLIENKPNNYISCVFVSKYCHKNAFWGNPVTSNGLSEIFKIPEIPWLFHGRSNPYYTTSLHISNLGKKCPLWAFNAMHGWANSYTIHREPLCRFMKISNMCMAFDDCFKNLLVPPLYWKWVSLITEEP